LYIVNLVSISFNSQMRFILRLKRKSKKATSANKITINKREIKDNARKAKKTKASAKANAKAKAIITTITTIIIATNKKQLLKLHNQFAYMYVNLVFEITSILLSCLLLFNNLREYANNALYNQKLIKLLN